MHLLIALALTTGFSTGYAQTLESRSAQLTRGIMEWLFSDGYVDIKCMWECARQWLPTEINPLGIDLIIGIPPNPDENCSTVLGFSSAQICHNSYSSMAFQRCYISVCGGLYTKIPEIPDSARQSGLSEDKKKLWSYISAYISNYSRGFAAFQGCNFGIYYSWAPMPIGITAACFSAPNQVFDQPDIKLMKMKQRLSTDGRLGVPQSIRRVLTPIWTSPELLDYMSYNLKLRHIEKIDEPRALSELYNHIIPTYLFSITAFAHLLSISSTSKYYIAEAFQLLAFCLVPLFPVVQTLHNLIDAITRLITGETWQWAYLFAGTSGVVIYEAATDMFQGYRARLLEVDVIDLEQSPEAPWDGKWLFRLLAILVNIALLSLTILSYFIRLNYKYGRASFCSATGFDHRIGWIATASLGPIIATLIIHLLNKEWKLQPTASREVRTTDWRLRMALDLTAAALVQDTLIMYTGRISLLQVVVGRILKNRLPIVSTIVIVVLASIISFWQPLSLAFSNPTRWLHKSLCLIALFLAFLFSLLVFILQTFLDMEEYADLALDFVLPWNYRWQIRDPSWSELFPH